MSRQLTKDMTEKKYLTKVLLNFFIRISA